MASYLYRLGHFCFRRRRWVLAIWIGLLIGTAALSAGLGGTTSDDFTMPGTESQQAADLLEERFSSESGSSTQLVFAVDEGSITDPGRSEAIEATIAKMGEVEGVSGAASPSLIQELTGEQQISDDGRVAIGMVQYPDGVMEVDEATIEAVVSAAETASDQGVQVEFGGEVIPGRDMEAGSSEVIGLLVAVIVLLVSFGSVLAMGLPIMTALIGLGIGMSGIGILSAITDLSSTAPTLAMMIGLAVGIDYALFVITRHRQNLALDLSVEESAARANATAGGAVVFAGITVVIALASLAVIGIPFLTVMGVAAAATVLVAVAVAITLLPAMLGFVGTNIDRFSVPGIKSQTGGIDEGATLGSRWAEKVTRRPGISLAAAMLFMAVLAIPVLSMRMGFPDAGSDPAASTQRKAYDLVTDAFGPGFNSTLIVAVDGAGVDDLEGAITTISERMEADPHVVAVGAPNLNEDGDLAILRITPDGGPAAPETENLVHDLRGDVRTELEEATGVEMYVAGTTAATIDISDKTSSALVPFMALVIGLTLVLLTAVFRSLVVPIKAAIAILVSIGSSFGVIVAVFNWGWLAGLIGVEQTIPIVSFLPMMMFAILFGLSMDYEVFILSRIHEEYHRTKNAKQAVLVGLGTSARVITAAALIMISVFAAFALGDSPIIKMFGIGLATAVFLDATVVRMVIVPAVMTLFGDKAWVLPGWLDKILPNLDVEGSGLVEELEAKDRAAALAKAQGPTEPALAD